MPFGNGQQRAEQRLSGGLERGEVGDRRGEALRPRDQREIGEFDLERDRPARCTSRPLDPLPGIAGDAAQLGGADRSGST